MKKAANNSSCTYCGTGACIGRTHPLRIVPLVLQGPLLTLKPPGFVTMGSLADLAGTERSEADIDFRRPGTQEGLPYLSGGTKSSRWSSPMNISSIDRSFGLTSNGIRKLKNSASEAEQETRSRLARADAHHDSRRILYPMHTTKDAERESQRWFSVVRQNFVNFAFDVYVRQLFGESNSPHESIGTHRCPYPGCSRYFSRVSSLSNHTKIHRRPQTVKCLFPDCGKMFLWRSSLREHGRLHTGERPFACLSCQQTFIWRASYNRHRSECTFEEPGLGSASK